MSDESIALVEHFLQGKGSSSTSEEPLPEDHRSGFVALVGRPNVGKSTLVNALVGTKIAAVSPVAQTTRRRILGILTTEAYQVIFIDTPGIHSKAKHKLNRRMVEEAVGAIPDADLILFVVDLSVPPRREDERIADLLKAKAKRSPVFFVLNKMDKLRLDQAEERIQAYWALYPDYVDSIPVSALQGTNVGLLLSHIVERLPQGPRYYPPGQVTDQAERQIAAELIREAILHRTRQEVPHAVAVLVEEFKERPNGMIYIAATIWVEKESQKPILIGKGGRRLKAIGAAARAELERFLGSRVYLELWVKVKPKWRDNEGRLRELGLM